MILIEKQPKYQPYHQAKLISMNILLSKKYYLLINYKWLNKLNLLILLWENPLKNKQKNWRSRQKQVEALKTKATEHKSDDNSSNIKEIYDKILEERMSKRINYKTLVDDFKGPTSSIRFTDFGGPM